MIDLRADAKYALIIPTSMGTRLTPINGQPFHSSDTFKMQGTSAESNVGSVSSFLGLPVKILTAFVKGSPVSRFLKDDLARRHMEFEGPEFDQGGLGAIGIKLTWQIVVPVRVDRAFKTIALAKLGVNWTRKILTSTESSATKELRSFT